MEIKPIVNFGFDIELYEDEIRMKGFCDNVHVTLPNGSRFKICFYDPIRLQQDIVDEKYIAIPGLIILQEITLNSMNEIISKLLRLGYFDTLTPQR